MLDLKLLGEELGALVVAEVARATEPLKAEVAELRAETEGLRHLAQVAGRLLDDAEARAEPKPLTLEFDAEHIRSIIDQATEAATATMRTVLASVSAPEPGRDGEPGAPGLPGEKGEPGEKGDPGDPGQDGKNGEDGKDGDPGQDGKDGIGLAGALIDRTGALILTTTAGETVSLGLVVGKDGLDGTDGLPGSDGVDGLPGEKGDPGRDGFSLEHFDAALQPDGRTIEFSFTQGDERFTVELAIPAMIYRGVFREGTAYAHGDTVTWAGSLWHCDEATADKPGESAKAWTLAVKKGRDGKEGSKGDPGDPGKPGPPGIDRRH